MKKHLGLLFKILTVLFFVVFLSKTAVYAYETVIINFPEGESWKVDYYQKGKDENIAIFVPKYQSRTNYSRAFVVHSYKKGNRQARSVNELLNLRLMELKQSNKTAKIQYIKTGESDAMAWWCAEKTAKMKAQCEIIRSTKAYEGLITMHYVNMNKDNFLATFNEWYGIVSSVKTYYSYYRTDRIMNKATSVEM